MEAQQWRTRRWQQVAEAAESLRRDSFVGASEGVILRLEKRLAYLEELATNVDRHGSSVEAMLRDTVVKELRSYREAQRTGRGAVLLLRWPFSLPARLLLARQLTHSEWGELLAQAPQRMKAIRRDLFLYERLVGPSGLSLTLADRLAGGVRQEPSPTTGTVLLP